MIPKSLIYSALRFAKPPSDRCSSRAEAAGAMMGRKHADYDRIVLWMLVALVIFVWGAAGLMIYLAPYF